jgi:ABC-type antimicrobial peptide transport system permease subunit
LWYRLGATFRHELGSYLTVALLLGLIGGLAMGSLAAARRTQSSYSALLATTNPSQIDLATAVASPGIGNGQGYDAAVVQEIARIPHVTAVASASGINAEPLGPNDVPIATASYPVEAGSSLGSVGGEYFRMDRLAMSAGRAADPARANEFVTSPSAAAALGFHVGEIVPMGFYTNSQTDSPAFGTAKVKPHRRIDMRLVGLGLPVTEIVTDDVDAGGALGYFTPALTHELLSCCVNYTETAIKVANPDEVAGIKDLITKAGGLPPGFQATGEDDEGKAERAIKPLSIALGVFGGIAALAALLIAMQVIGRQLRRRRQEAEVLRALGADRTTLASDALIGVVGAVAVGSLLAVGVAVALSPLSPFGPIRPFYPTPGVSFDWTVLGGGFGVLFLGPVLGAIGLAVSNSPSSSARRRRLATKTTLLRGDRMLGLPAPAATGLRFALQPGTETDAVPMRSAIVGAALAAIVLVATVTFGASLDHLVSTPRLYGWNWSFALSGGDGGGGGDIPERQAATLLAHDRYLSAYSGVYFVNVIVDGQDVPVIATSPGARVQPPLLDGHDLQQSDEMVVGALTLASLHKKLGDSVTVRSGAGGPHLLRIVGVATLPAIGGTGNLHLEMGTGAVVSTSLIPAVERNPFNDPETGPQAYFIDVRPGVNLSAARRSLEAMTAPLTNAYNFGVVVQSVLRPAEIVDYRSMGTTPAILGASLGAAALAALGLTLLASVRRRRRDLAVLKILGFTRYQLSAMVAWQSNLAIAVGTIVGIPVGITLGRTLWDLFAREINAVSSPSVPVVPIVLIAFGALVLGNLVAAVPGRIAARTPAALLLRTE